MTLADLRREYTAGTLSRKDLNPDPVEQFRKWFNEAVNLKSAEPNAMVLATVSATGQPNARVVLLKGLDERGFIFFTNYESAKGAEIAANPHCCLHFYWHELERQVVIRGTAQKLAAEESEKYFTSRPLFNRLAAWASMQSRPIASRAALDERMAEVTARFKTDEIPLPPFWGGYLVSPHAIEFWQGRAGRFHDRFLYNREESGQWTIQRLMP